MSSPPKQQEVRLPAIPESVPDARYFVSHFFAEHGVPADAVVDLELATSEAASNAVEHGAPCDGGVFVVRALIEGPAAVEVCDCGQFNENRPSQPFRGLGLRIIRELCDIVTIEPAADRTLVRLIKAV
jgi:anti-sigma regulatory factor (Ser/Thr protein kinase)